MVDVDKGYLLACTISSLGGFVVGLSVRAVLNGVVHACNFLRDVPHKAMVIGGLVVLVGAASTAMLFMQGRELRDQREYLIRVTDCQTKANEAFREALENRSAASAGQLEAQFGQINQQVAQNEAQDELLGAGGDGVVAASPAAIQRYQVLLRQNTEALKLVARKLGEAQQARAQNPYPSLDCGAP